MCASGQVKRNHPEHGSGVVQKTPRGSASLDIGELDRGSRKWGWGVGGADKEHSSHRGTGATQGSSEGGILLAPALLCQRSASAKSARPHPLLLTVYTPHCLVESQSPETLGGRLTVLPAIIRGGYRGS